MCVGVTGFYTESFHMDVRKYVCWDLDVGFVVEWVSDRKEWRMMARNNIIIVAKLVYKV